MPIKQMRILPVLICTVLGALVALITGCGPKPGDTITADPPKDATAAPVASMKAGGGGPMAPETAKFMTVKKKH